MEAVYFPFVFFDVAAAADWLDCFSRLGIYCPGDLDVCPELAEAAKQGRINLHLPCPENSKELAAMCRSYQHWRRSQAGGVDSAFLRATAGTIPFFDETTISYLKQDIHDVVAEKSRQEVDSLLMAQLFLRFTREYDREQALLAESLRSLEQRRKTMLAGLRADEEEGSPFSAQKGTGGKEAADPDTGAYLTAERLRAWAILAAHGGGSPDVLVTGSRAVFDYVREMVPGAVTIIEDAPGAPASASWREKLREFFQQLVAVGKAELSTVLFPEVAPAGEPLFWNIVSVPDLSPADFITFFAGDDHGVPAASEEDRKAEAATVVVGLDRRPRNLE